jgi:hypothetical protein
VTSLIVGTAGLNLVFLSVGYGLLARVLRGSSVVVWLTYAGVALLVGIAATGVVLCTVAVTGARVGVPAFAAVATTLAALGVVAAVLRPAPLPRSTRADSDGRRADLVATVACTLLACLLAIAFIGAFRATPWLSDSWTFWLPKGIALDKVGLDPRLWTGSSNTAAFDVPDYPLLWSILTNLDIRFVGRVDMRAVNVQEAYLLIGFAGAVARLLWGILRPWVLWCGVLASLALPELLRHAQGGAADVPVALFSTGALVAAAAWLLRRSSIALALTGVFAAAAFSTKSESYPDIALWLVVLTIAAWPLAGKRLLLPVWGAVLLGAATSLPWLVWKAAHHLQSQIRLSDLFSPSYLAHHRSALHASYTVITHHYTSVREWTLVFPLLALAGIAGSLLDRDRARRGLWLAAPAYVVLSCALLIWIFWADRNGAFRLGNSAYRLVDVFAISSALGAAVAVEFIFRRLRAPA